SSLRSVTCASSTFKEYSWALSTFLRSVSVAKRWTSISCWRTSSWRVCSAMSWVTTSGTTCGGVAGTCGFVGPEPVIARPTLFALRRSGAQVRASQIAVGDAPSHNIGQYADESRAIVAGALIEAAHLLIHIAEQVERVHADVGAFDRPLQQAPEVFQAVGMDL